MGGIYYKKYNFIEKKHKKMWLRAFQNSVKNVSGHKE